MGITISLYDIFWFFILYAFLGWCAEVAFVAVNTGELVNRGFLNGPVCPIYGAGMVLVLLFTAPLAHNLFLLFLGGMAVASALELVTGWALKKLFHTSWWDYSDKPFNLGGYICLSFSILWGLGVVAVVRLVHPMIAQLVAAIPHRLGTALALPLSLVFLADAAVTVRTIVGLNRSLGELDRVAEALHRGSDAMALRLGSAALAADEELDEGKEKLAAALGEGRQKLAGGRAELEARRDLLRGQLLDSRLFGAARLLRAFPAMKHVQHRERLEELQQRLRSRLGR